MQLGPRARAVLSWVFLPFFLVSAGLQLLGVALGRGGRLVGGFGSRLYLEMHGVVREPGCSCADCAPLARRR
jgi:hypothetical protein